MLRIFLYNKNINGIDSASQVSLVARERSKESSMSNKASFNKNSTKSIKKLIFNPQPYRIILKLSGANPSAPAETVTEALRKAGVDFEVEKIELIDETKLLKDSSFKRKQF